MTIVGALLLGQGGGTTTDPAALTPSDKSPEQSAPDADPAAAGNNDSSRYDRLNGPFYRFLGIDPCDPHAVTAKPKLPKQEVERSVGWLEFLIVTVADPIDTHLGYRFDQQIETLHRVCAAEGYVIDPFYLPWDKENKEDRHHTEPGLLLYRNQRPNQDDERSKDKTDLLAVYLVGETPTGGIQTGAFRFAVRHISGIANQVPPRRGLEHRAEFMVSGPYFSGAAESLARAIRDCRRELTEETEADHSMRPVFRVITGSALSVNHHRFLQLAGEGAPSFARTASAFMRQLRRTSN